MDARLYKALRPAIIDGKHIDIGDEFPLDLDREGRDVIVEQLEAAGVIEELRALSEEEATAPKTKREKAAAAKQGEAPPSGDGTQTGEGGQPGAGA